MPLTGAVPAAVVAAAFAAFVLVPNQRRLYREPAFRHAPLRGGRLRRYQVAIALAATLVTLLALRPDHYDLAPGLLSVAWGLTLLLVASTDLERRRIPNRLTYPAVLFALATGWAWPDRTWGEVGTGFVLAGGVALAVYYIGFALGRTAGLGVAPFGLGDAKLIALGGAVLGWPLVLPGIILGVIFGGVPSLVNVARGRGRASFSYGPYLVAGLLVALLFPGSFT